MAGLALADGGVESANVVGYQQVTVSEQYTILAVNFTAVDGTSNIALQDALPYASGMTKGPDYGSADTIQIQDGRGGYNIYYMSNGMGAKGAVAGLDGKWSAQGKAAVSDVTLAPGTAFWFCRYKENKDAELSPLTINIAGGVSKLASNNRGINESYKLIANPYPTPLLLNDGIPYVAGMTKGPDYGSADTIQIQDGRGGYNIYYMSNGMGAKGAVAGLEGKWSAQGKAAETDAAIPVGKGAWFCRKGSADFDITVVRPYTIE